MDRRAKVRKRRINFASVSTNKGGQFSLRYPLEFFKGTKNFLDADKKTAFGREEKKKREKVLDNVETNFLPHSKERCLQLWKASKLNKRTVKASVRRGTPTTEMRLKYGPGNDGYPTRGLGALKNGKKRVDNVQPVPQSFDKTPVPSSKKTTQRRRCWTDFQKRVPKIKKDRK